MRRAVVGIGGLLVLASVNACGSSAQVAPTTPVQKVKASEDAKSKPAELPPLPLATAMTPEPGVRSPSGSWIGAAAESEVILAGTRETFLGVWVDVPGEKPRTRAPVDLALVVDTSGSMSGDKIQSARAAARTLVSNLSDGDIVSIDAFSDHGRTLLAPTTIDARSRERALSVIGQLGAGGDTNMFEGISLGQAHMAAAPTSHTVRRIVLISDGQANVGPSSPQALALLAERSLSFRSQVTSLGVGTDYDENTLNAVAVRTSGRLFHIGKSQEMATALKQELDLLGSTVASDAYVEVVPAAGVELVAADGMRVDRGEGGSLRIPFGALFSGQHKEALVRVRLTSERTPRTLASVRLHYHDPNEGDVQRVQEVVARADSTSDPAAVVASTNARTKSIVAFQESARLKMRAAQEVSQGKMAEADKQLREAEEELRKEARASRDERSQRRLQAAAEQVAEDRAAIRALPPASAASPAPARGAALKLNKSGMADLGY